MLHKMLTLKIADFIKPLTYLQIIFFIKDDGTN